MAEVAVLTARLEGDIRDFDRSMRTAERRLNDLDHSVGTASKTTQGLGSRFGELGGVMRAVFAGAAAAAVIDFTRDAIKAASDLGESVNAVQVTFGPFADEVLAIGENAADSFGLAQSEFNQFAVRFSAFAEQIAGPGGDVAEVVESITQRVADFASVHNVDVPQAAQILQSALAGETEAFRRFGGDVSAAAVQQKALELGLGATSEELTEQDKILARYHLIMEQTEETAGDFANTSDDLANLQRRLTARWKDAQAEIGQRLLPVMEDLSRLAMDLIPTFTTLATVVIELGLGAFKPFIDTLRLLNEVLPGTSENLDDIAELADFVSDAVGGILNVVAPLSGAWYNLSRLLEETSAEEAAAASFQKLGGEMNQIPAAAQRAESAAGDLADGMEGVEEETKAATTALQRFEEEVRAQTDPLFNLVQKTRDLEAADQAVADALDEFGDGSPQHIQALEDQALAWLDLKEAQLRVAEESDLTRQQFETMLRNMAILTEQEIDLIIAEFERADAFRFSDKTIRVIGDVRLPSGRTPVSGRQHGGPVQAHTPFLVGEAGPEIFVPDRPGTIATGMSMGGEVVVTVPVSLDGRLLYQVVKRQAVRDSRRNGETGF